MDDGADDTSAGAAYRYRWDVFLSFRGVDTRKGFVAGLYDELGRRDVRAFRDDEGTERGDEITPTILAAIEDSAAAIAVISENYANSKRCLDELATIFERRKLVVPVFYGVDPSDVRRQKGNFEAEFLKYEQEVEPGKVKRWRNAMNGAGNISGLDSRFGKEESEIIEILVKRVLKELVNTPLGVAKYPIGLDTRLELYLEKLDVKSNDVRIIGFYGMGGIGKTTLAKALFNKLIVHFKKRSFISNVREESQKPNGLESLQAKLLANFDSSKPVSDTGKGILFIKQITHNEPVLIVLDDIDSSNQLHALAGGRDWFHGGSRIIITSRDKRNFPNYVHDYEVNKLTDDESVRLFSYHALGQEQPTQDLALITKHIVSLTGGLPLALEVFGSSLFYKRSNKEWVDSYEKLQKVRPGNLQDILRVSFESLNEEERCVFLDLACFFVSMKMKRDDVVDIFKGCGFDAESIVTELTGKSLVRVVDENVLWMHDQLREMGKEIVRQEDYVDCGQRSRLWDRDEILNVLKNEKGTRKIEGIILDFSRKHDSAFAISDSIKPQASFGILECLKNYILHICHGKENDDDDDDDETVLPTKSFNPMLHLRLLQINNAKLDRDFKLLPAELKWLQWKGCPLKTLPPEFHAQQDLAVLDLSESQICQLWSQRWWDSHGRKSLDFSYNSFTSLPSSLRRLSMLKTLLLPHCEELKTLPPLPDSLFRLNVADCFELELMHDVSNLASLEELELTNCRKVVDIPGLEKLKSLRRLYTGGCEACFSSVQKRLSKEALRYISYLCVPGSEIPNWFVQEVTELSWPKNRELKGVIIALVVSLDQHAQENGFRDMIPAIVDIQARIIRRNKLIFTTTPNLRGVPNTDQHQLYLCHYHDYDNLLLVLEHGDALQLATREKPYFPGMTLEKHGIHLVFENDDDYDECDEALLIESEQSVSTRLSNFFTSLYMG